LNNSLSRSSGRDQLSLEPMGKAPTSDNAACIKVMVDSE